MGLPEELYCALLEVGYSAKRRKIPELGDHAINTARKYLPFWRADERAMVTYARGVLRGPTNLRTTTGQLPEPVASACWRLISLLEYIAHETEIH